MEQNKNDTNGLTSNFKNNKTLWFSILGAIILVVLIVAAPKPKTSTTATPAATTEQTPGQTLTQTQESLSTPASTTSTSAPSYAAVVEQYKGKRIEFNISCAATPRTVTVAKGEKMMFDNQSTKAHVITIGSATYEIGAYKYRTFSSAVAGAFSVNCDAMKDQAAVIVQ